MNLDYDTGNATNYIKKIPLIVPSDEMLETINGMVEDMIDALKRGEMIECEWICLYIR